MKELLKRLNAVLESINSLRNNEIAELKNKFAMLGKEIDEIDSKVPPRTFKGNDIHLLPDMVEKFNEALDMVDESIEGSLESIETILGNILVDNGFFG